MDKRYSQELIDDNVISKANSLKYSSLNYVDMEDIKEAKLIMDTDSVIFMYQNSVIKKELYWESDSNHSFQLFWAADSIESFLNGLNKSIEYIRMAESNYDKIYIEFVPDDFLDEMGNIGFNIVSEWVDYWNMELRPKETTCRDNINIQTVSEKDISIASKITKSCTGYSRGFTGQSEELIREWMNTENSYLFLGEVDGNVVGLCFVILYGFDSDKGIVLWIRELVVNPKYHSKGIGRRLIVHGINWGIENGAKRSFLAVDAENINAIKLYESLGYKRKDERGQINMELTL
ncbi:MAG TPA: hypothetical protein DCM73_12160 [Clostridiales bacterium]|nr:hypothetical protein [Clostridiales bacterium]